MYVIVVKVVVFGEVFGFEFCIYIDLVIDNVKVLVEVL